MTMLGRRPSAASSRQPFLASTPAQHSPSSSHSESTNIPAHNDEPLRPNDVSGGVSNTLFALVEQFFGPPRDNGSRQEEARQHCVEQSFQFAMRLISSHMEPVLIPDEKSFIDGIKRRLMRGDKNSLEKALHFSNLFEKLTNKSTLTHRWACLYFLSSVGGHFPSNEFEDTSLFSIGVTSSLLPERKRSDGPRVVAFESTYSSNEPRVGRPDGRDSRRTSTTSVPRDHNAISEPQWIRDIVYVFQGIDGQYLKFDKSADTYVIDAQVPIPGPQREIILRLAEMGWLYRRVNTFIDEWKKDTSSGLIRQSFCSALASEMTDYYRLIAILQSQVTSSEDETNQSLPLTLKRLYLWTQDPLHRLKIMGVLVNLCCEERGGSLLSVIDNYVHHGDPFTQQFIHHLMMEVSKPFYVMLKRWVYHGELDDPFEEFFILEAEDVKDEDFWECKYSMRDDMIPAFLPVALAKKALKIGKSLNFVRHACGENQFMVARSKPGQNAEDLFRYGSRKALTSYLDFAYMQTNAKVRTLLLEKYKLMEHMEAVKRYLLLEQGDMYQYIVDEIGKDLYKPATNLYRHNLAAALQGGIRMSNAQHDDPDIVRRLDVHVMEVSDGDTGWDVFSLTYKATAPIDTILNSKAARAFSRITNFLWSMKRIDHALSSAWKPRMRLASNLGDSAVYPDLHSCLLIWSQMQHFVVQMHYFLLFEVIECAWADFKTCILDEKKDLDDILYAHKEYLQVLTKGSMLNLCLQDESVPILTRIVDAILEFHTAQERLHRYGSSLIRQQQTTAIDYRERSFDLSLSNIALAGIDLDEDEDTLDAVRKELKNAQKKFEDNLWKFIGHLITSDEECKRGLGVRLNFNQFYTKSK